MKNVPGHPRSCVCDDCVHYDEWKTMLSEIKEQPNLQVKINALIDMVEGVREIVMDLRKRQP